VDQYVTIVDTELKAKKLLDDIRQLPKSTVFGCDTEVADIDVRSQGPVGNGVVTCISIYAGEKISFGNGPNVWVDTFGEEKEGIIRHMKEFFENEDQKKVWHNYGFDRHVLYNIGIDAKGFEADTMHMARLHDSSRDKTNKGGGGYSLESLSGDYLKSPKTAMKTLFGVKSILVSGAESKISILPPIADIQNSTDEETRAKWIWYSCLDAASTWKLYEFLKAKLLLVTWRFNHDLFMKNYKTVEEYEESRRHRMFHLYEEYLRPMGDVLTDMERIGFQLDLDHLQTIEKIAAADTEKSISDFKRLIYKSGCVETMYDANLLNPASALQKQFILFSKDGYLQGSKKSLSKLKSSRSKAEKKGQKELDLLNSKIAAIEQGKPAEFKVENSIGFLEPGKLKPLRQRPLAIRGFGIQADKYTPSGWPAVSSDVLRELAGNPEADPPQWGLAKTLIKDKKVAELACKAIYNLNKANATEKLLSSFIKPLQALSINHRIHCSLNLNTETGRLSSRQPNLQNQPALEKDIYKIRKAFVAKPGCKLIVADYGQLELRVLAHLSNCTSMIEAFEAGGDFHSRTALSMYAYIKKELDDGQVLLEWDYSNGTKPTVPLIKDKFGSERRKAKVLNFSIAYGKTAKGLALDWGVSVQEAEDTVKKWYDSRPEVKQWQDAMKKYCHDYGSVFTLWGRERKIPDINHHDEQLQRASERAAINTPIQGSAADIVMSAMIKISRNKRLKELGWKMVLQVHDEIILEGPEESTDEAMTHVVHDMEHPLDIKFLVDMIVDADSAYSWYEAK